MPEKKEPTKLKKSFSTDSYLKKFHKYSPPFSFFLNNSKSYPSSNDNFIKKLKNFFLNDQQTMIKAILWDVDKTIFDTLPPHHQSWTVACAQQGAVFVDLETFITKYGGVGFNDTIKIIEEINHKKLDADLMKVRKTQSFEELLDLVKPIQPTIDLIRHCHGLEMPMALVSGSHKDIIKRLLHKHDLATCFKDELIFGCEEVSQGKPSAVGYLSAANLLGIDPKYCLVVGDSLGDFEAAERGGMQYIDAKDLEKATRIPSLHVTDHSADMDFTNWPGYVVKIS